jgi:hypothetical protein
MSDTPREVSANLDAPPPVTDETAGSVGSDPHGAPQNLGPPQQDESDVDIRGIGRFLAGMVVSLVVVAALIYLQVVRLGRRLDEERPPAAFRAGERLPPPAPILQRSAREEIRALRIGQEEALTKSAWVDRDHRIVQIPIDRAMKRLAREGLPNWPEVKPEATPTSTARPVGNTVPGVPSATRPEPASATGHPAATASATPSATSSATLSATPTSTRPTASSTVPPAATPSASPKPEQKP